MTDVKTTAERCLVYVCGHLALSVVKDENHQLWLSALQEVIPNTVDCPASMLPLQRAARELSEAADGVARQAAESWLRIEAKHYFARAAGISFEAFRAAKGAA